MADHRVVLAEPQRPAGRTARGWCERDDPSREVLPKRLLRSLPTAATPSSQAKTLRSYPVGKEATPPPRPCTREALHLATDSLRTSKRARTVMQLSVLIPVYGRPTRFGHEPDHRTAAQSGPEREEDQRLRWSAAMWSPPPESNRRPHPYHGTTRNRCANRRSPRSRPTVGVEVIGSLSAKLCVHSSHG